MATAYIDVSKETYRNYLLPDSIAAHFGLPLVSVDEETGEETPLQWTLFDGFASHKHPAGNPFPIQEDADGVPQREGFSVADEEETAWLVPLASEGGDLHEFIMMLAEAKAVPYYHVFMSVLQTQQYLANGSRPEPLT